MGAASGIVASLIGRTEQLPPDLVARFPELTACRIRRGGLLVRIGGWPLGLRTVSAITLWRTVFIAPTAALTPHLLLHELCHVEQFCESRIFPLRYLWEWIRHGYHANRFERDAHDYACRRLAAVRIPTSAEDV